MEINDFGNAKVLPLYCGTQVAYFAKLIPFESIGFALPTISKRGSLINRIPLAGPHGLIVLTIPIIGAGRKAGKTLGLNEIKIADSVNTGRQLLKNLQSLYGKSAYYDYYKAEINSLIANLTDDSLLNLNTKLAKFICSQLKLKPVFLNERLSTMAVVSDVKPYHQVFADRCGFVQGCSILDALFNLGPATLTTIS